MPYNNMYIWPPFKKWNYEKWNNKYSLILLGILKNHRNGKKIWNIFKEVKKKNEISVKIKFIILVMFFLF